MMNYGFVKTACATPQIHVADCSFNEQAILTSVRVAEQAGVEILCLPELCITGYTCGDLFFQDTLLNSAEEALRTLLHDTQEFSLLIVVGLPLRHNGKIYNCAAVLQQGKLLGIVPKTHIPNYNEFYERRHFVPAPPENETFFFDGVSIPFGTKLLFRSRQNKNLCMAVEICEDLWAPLPPSVSHAMAGAVLIANLSASDETIGKAEYRRSLVEGQSARLLCGYLYADAGDGESTTDMVFAGHNLIAENGSILAQSQLFQNGLICSEIDVDRLAGERLKNTSFDASKQDGYAVVSFETAKKETTLTRRIDPAPFVPSDPAHRARRCSAILAMQANGLKKRLAHTGCSSAVVGISGGLDSTLALLVVTRAFKELGRPLSDITAVTMPCFGTTQRTRNNAEKLCRALDVTLREVNITETVQSNFRDIGQDPQTHDVTFENTQARVRTLVLMNLANRTNGLVIGTGDLSELALGWATYNGDHMSMYGVNASVPKTLVRHIVATVADTTDSSELRDVLRDILDTPVSPELLPAKDGVISQQTEEIVGPYDLHDFFLYYAVRWGFSPAKVFFLAQNAFRDQFEDAVILKWLRKFYWRFFSQQFKRSCVPDGPKVGTVTLSPRGDWRMPSDACAAAWIQELDHLEQNKKEG